MKRESYTLTPDEIKEFKRLPPLPGDAFKFWQKVAHTRGLDYKTIIGTDCDFTGLPMDHGTHWCSPSPLKCIAPPPKQ